MKSKRVNVWNSSLQLGEKAENMIREKIEQFITKISIKKMDYSFYPEIQMQGIDAILTLDPAKVDIKARLHYALKYNDILIELKTNQKLGWYYTTRADWIAYVFFNDTQTELEKGYLITIQNPKLRQFIDANLGTYDKREAKSEHKGVYWVTLNLCVPIADFPQGTIFEFINPANVSYGMNQKLTEYISK